MRRKLVKQGRNALTITLPATWTKKFGLKAGDEVEIEEEGRSVIIGGQGEGRPRKASIDSTKISERVLRWFLSGLHKGGWDEIEILFDKKETLDVIDDLIKNLLMGFAVVEQTGSRCLLKKVSMDMDTEFDSILRRAFLVTIAMGDSCISMIRENKLKEMKDLISLEKTNNQLTNFCERILNKKGYKDNDKTCFVYVIAWNLEKVCDYYKYVCEYLSDNPDAEIKEDVLKMMEEANNQIRSYNSLFSKFKEEDLIELNNKKKDIVNRIENMLTKKNRHEVFVLNHMMFLVKTCEDFSTSMFMLNYH